MQEIVNDKTNVETKNCWSLYMHLCVSLESEIVKYFIKPILRLKEYMSEVVSGIKGKKTRKCGRNRRVSFNGA